jgi:general secretion pathway protein F
MPIFSISAVDPLGKVIEQTYMAADQLAAVEIARERGLTPVKVRVADANVRSTAAAQRKVPGADLAFMFSQLAVLLKAGLEVDRALTLVETMVKRPQSKEELRSMRQSLLEGRSLTDYVTEKTTIYPSFIVGAVRAGESSGGLDTAFGQIGRLIERQIALKRKIITALVYPGFLAVGSLVSVIMLLTVVLPRFEPLFASAGVALPFTTRALIAVSDWTIELAPAALLVLLAGWLISRQWLQNPVNKERLHRRLLSTPILGTLLMESQLARFSLMVASLLRAGVPLLNGLNTGTLSLSNIALAASLRAAATRLRDGKTLADALSADRSLPDLFVQLIRVGEETAKLDRSFQEIGEIYERDVASDMQRFLAMIAPATTICVGIVIAAIIAAILSAVLKINDLALT